MMHKFFLTCFIDRVHYARLLTSEMFLCILIAPYMNPGMFLGRADAVGMDYEKPFGGVNVPGGDPEMFLRRVIARDVDCEMFLAKVDALAMEY